MHAHGLGPNEGLIGQQGSRASLTTPALVIDLDALERNIAKLAARAKADGLALRPHAKTHKCAEIAKLQVEAGAQGVCAATLREAETLVAGGIPGVLITSPTVGGAKLARLSALNARADGLMAVLDNPDNLAALDRAAGEAGKALGVLVDVDVGMGRTGAREPETVVALARAAADAETLTFRGVQGYSGMVQHIETYAEREKVYGAQLDHLENVAAALSEAGLAPEIISGGGTGSYGIDAGRGLFTEHQSGSYLFMDVQYNAVELLPGGEMPWETALLIQNRVISNNRADFVTTDGGFKCFATDGPFPEIVAGAPMGAQYTYFGDEFGRIVFAHAADHMELGAVVELASPHCDPTVNLHDFYHCVRGDTLVAIWPVAGRGVL